MEQCVTAKKWLSVYVCEMPSQPSPAVSDPSALSEAVLGYLPEYRVDIRIYNHEITQD